MGVHSIVLSTCGMSESSIINCDNSSNPCGGATVMGWGEEALERRETRVQEGLQVGSGIWDKSLITAPVCQADGGGGGRTACQRDSTCKGK